MSTTGVYGFIKNGVEKIGYNHCDSYLYDLGANIAKFINETTKEEMEEIFEKIILVDDSIEATEEQIKKCEKWFLPMTDEKKSTWYNLIRLAQGNLNLHKEGELEYMFNGKDMYANYKYIINLDNNEFEIYETDLETEEEKVIGIYQLDKVTESDIQELYKIRLEEKERIALVRKEEKEKMLSEKVKELSQDEEFIKYYHNELSSQREKFERFLDMGGIKSLVDVIESRVDVKELNKITDEKEKEKILLEKTEEIYRLMVFNKCISKYTGITL
ncbi:hypothetical protein GKZ28_14440 [Clostridium chromiireducens]|uniref:Uncharacterized protein n=1 Tax=Clostridium chromiireducens TaxID=225345 RepID=A0A964RNL9_9CLOT|nr:hypothetical protein [Clostridium chromiireducens]MVX64893.1 hypothetical protein [Clostridium chromiireducens]